jgi:catechol 2,3-dioxygenase-like lactoylglutathione lyase family enzyme
VTLPAKDIGASRHFYGDVLGLPFVKNYGDKPASEYQAGNLTLTIMEPGAFGQEFRPHGLPVALQVQDVAAAREALEALEAQGVQFVTETFDSGVCHQAIFLDPRATLSTSTIATRPAAVWPDATSAGPGA